MSSHAFFPASGASRWLRCGASVIIDTRHLSEEYKPAADRGTRLHAVAEEWLRADVETIDDAAGLSPPDFEAVEAYVNFVKARPGKRYYELSTDIIPDVKGVCGGTSDCVVLYPGGKILEIIDAKFGSWFVDPKDNKQLVIYALGVLRRFAAVYDIDTVALTIAQPACDNFRTWSLSVEELKRIGEGIIHRVSAIMQGDAEFEPDEETCKWCPGRTICPAFAEYGKAAARAEFAEDTEYGKWPSSDEGLVETRWESEILDKEALDWTWSEKMVVAERAASWAKMVKDTVKQMVLEDPDAVPGRKVVEGKRSRDWDGDEGKKAARDYFMREGFGETDIYVGEPSFVSPAQGEKLFKGRGSGAKKKELGEFIKSFPGAPTVVPESDSRPALNRKGQARKEFEEPPGDGDGDRE